MGKIAIITDTWMGNVSGVVTSLLQTKSALEQEGFQVRIIHPKEFKSLPAPSYPEIRLALVTPNRIENILLDERPEYIHIATEGPVGLAARKACVNNNWRFTSYYYTQIPEYVKFRKYFQYFENMAYDYLRWFHNASQRTLVSANSIKEKLEEKNFKHLFVVPLGVDIKLFKKNPRAVVPAGLKKPIFMFLGRVAPEKNLEDFLNCDLPGSKLVIGDGPEKQSLETKFRDKAKFVGFKKGQELIDLISISDVMVFPSKTETFGIAALEAMSCGVPVAAYNAPGPKDIIANGVDGYLGDDLAANAIKCLKINPQNCIKKASKFSSDNYARNLISNLTRV